MNYTGTGEGIYWTADGRLMVPQGPRLIRFSPFTREESVVLDVSATHPDCDLFQPHSSDDGRVHSATVRSISADGPYLNIGTVICKDGEQHYYAAAMALDESAVDASGRYVLIKEGNDNRIILTSAWGERWLSDVEGALGHSDMGNGFAIGEVSHDNVGLCAWMDLATLTQRKLFDTWNLGHVSVRGNRCLRSDSTHLTLVDTATGLETEVAEHGMVSDGTYDTQVFANLDPSARVAAYLSNHGTDRLDLDLVVL